MADVWDFGPEDAAQCEVLVCLANHCDDNGKSCYPSIARIARMSRRSERTVSRVIAALEEDGWITVERGAGRGVMSRYQIELGRLKRCHGVTFSGDEAAAEKVTSVQEKVTSTTQKGDIHDNPPHPPLGRTVIEPSKNLTPPTPSRGEGERAPGEPAAASPEAVEDATPLTAEQEAHLATVTDPALRKGFAESYRAQNRERIQRDREENRELARLERLRESLPDCESARDWVMRECGFVRATGRGIGAVLYGLMALERERGSPPWEAAPRMAAAWRRYVAEGPNLRVQYGPRKFFELGIWRDERGWARDEARLARERGARIGS